MENNYTKEEVILLAEMLNELQYFEGFHCDNILKKYFTSDVTYPNEALKLAIIHLFLKGSPYILKLVFTEPYEDLPLLINGQEGSPALTIIKWRLKVGK